jgi:hypothetical protein
MYRIDSDSVKKVYPVTYKEAILYLEAKRRFEEIV